MNSPLILFGAGASFGSDTIGVPPLGGNLYEALRVFGPDTWGRLTGPTAELLRTDFEAGIRRFGEERGHDLAPLQRVMASYFFAFQPRVGSLYVRLARAIKGTRWAGAVASLNYERLLELSLRYAGLDVIVSPKAVGTAGIELCLPHGCCHLFDNSVRMNSSAVRFDAFAIRTGGGAPVAIENPPDHAQRIRGDALPPIMSYFEPQKRTTAGAGFIDGQRARWNELVQAADSIAIIGVHVRTHDDHLWRPLAGASGRITYVAGEAGAESFRTWQGAHRPNAKDKIIPMYFAEAFPQLLRELGLEER